MNSVVALSNVTKRYGDVTALDGVSFAVRENTITGLLGRNGAGKSTLMRLLTGQDLAGSGRTEIFGARPYENEAVLSQVSFIKENQRYPDNFKVRHVLRAARTLYPNWDQDFADSLMEDFRLPLNRRMNRLSRGMFSAVGIVLGLASRAPLTLFDEPYLGLDAVARQLFYDRLLADYAENPRTVVLSTHLIDEVSDLIEHVLLIDGGRMLLDQDAETLREQAVTVTGPTAAVDEFTAGRDELHREQMGGFARVTVRSTGDSTERTRAHSHGVELEPVSLQQLVVHTTTRNTSSKESSR
ncbi:ABC-2 type transport system ATP-binding protein [Halopolyspora algeriensis]|uniref:ABC-2 type transport system ATP-binding protein n=1 Tax=Halopolyspora algeriensis TaxID=1500506 RepID=A0A368VJ86_9ACTN|nr:ABC transporter ATP-binding protein [Halopolyspora algeriensis]RCW40471.1 ABC-2 type transport system ATP-binding protein [Halopolyspora algeriensis]TQM53754.1 ABC-2 type transport system ATP-binding protein [Halopolyspora algeriensis]